MADEYINNCLLSCGVNLNIENDNGTTKTFVLVLDFKKFRTMPEYRLAYKILNFQKKKQARYIENALKYHLSINDDKLKFEDNTSANSQTTKFIEYLQYLKSLNIRYRIDSVDDLQAVLEADINGDFYSKLKSNLLPEKEPTKMSCGFSCTSNGKATYAFLLHHNMNDRVAFVTTILKQFVDGGNDMTIHTKLEDQILIEAIDAYQGHPEQQNKILKNFEVLRKNSMEIESIFDIQQEEIINDEYISQEIKRLFSSDKEMESIF